MIDLHYWPTPNGWKISIMLEECGLPYTLKPVNIGRCAIRARCARRLRVSAAAPRTRCTAPRRG